MSYAVPIPRLRSPDKYVKMILNRRDPRKEEHSNLRIFALYIILYSLTYTVAGYRMTVRGSWKLKEEAIDRTVWRTGFGRDYVSVVRQTAAAVLNMRSKEPCG